MELHLKACLDDESIDFLAFELVEALKEEELVDARSPLEICLFFDKFSALSSRF